MKIHVGIKCVTLDLLSHLSSLLSKKAIFKFNTNALSLRALVTLPATPLQEDKIVLVCLKIKSKGRNP